MSRRYIDLFSVDCFFGMRERNGLRDRMKKSKIREQCIKRPAWNKPDRITNDKINRTYLKYNL